MSMHYAGGATTGPKEAAGGVLEEVQKVGGVGGTTGPSQQVTGHEVQYFTQFECASHPLLRWFCFSAALFVGLFALECSTANANEWKARSSLVKIWVF